MIIRFEILPTRQFSRTRTREERRMKTVVFFLERTIARARDQRQITEARSILRNPNWLLSLARRVLHTHTYVTRTHI